MPKIEVGKTYETRGGAKVNIWGHNPHVSGLNGDSDYCFHGRHLSNGIDETWTATGAFISDTSPNLLDLVGEVATYTEVQAGDLRAEVQELREEMRQLRMAIAETLSITQSRIRVR